MNPSDAEPHGHSHSPTGHPGSGELAERIGRVIQISLGRDDGSDLPAAEGFLEVP